MTVQYYNFHWTFLPSVQYVQSIFPSNYFQISCSTIISNFNWCSYDCISPSQTRWQRCKGLFCPPLGCPESVGSCDGHTFYLQSTVRRDHRGVRGRPLNTFSTNLARKIFHAYSKIPRDIRFAPDIWSHCAGAGEDHICRLSGGTSRNGP